ncbi:MAG: site-2 protease family protein [Planctomycetales bacterium]|nr:site-2 protease family protein [Planctomycetales bacterium]
MSTPQPPDDPSQSLPSTISPAGDEFSVGQSAYRELRASDIDSSIRPGGGPPLRVRRGVRLPVILFIATCLSTFWVGAANWYPTDVQYVGSYQAIWQTIQINWHQGVYYMLAVLGILLTHEMGHFLMTLRHRIPASYPLCIPVPINPIGTMGAVISMDGMRANRKEIFDIGLAGPLAGLVVAFPILWLGVQQLDLNRPVQTDEILLYNPVVVRWMIDYAHPEFAGRSSWVAISQLQGNPLFMAGWVGMLVTGLNMLPVSQLDGGHTIHGLFGKESYKIARGFTVVAIVYVVSYLEQASIWAIMLILVILMGIHHPPTADDDVELDDKRWYIGMASLSIPILCFPLLGIAT